MHPCKCLTIPSSNVFPRLSVSWAANCAANAATNGVDERQQGNFPKNARIAPKHAKANIIDGLLSKAVGLPGPFLPTAPPVNGSEDVIKSFILPDKKTGVVCGLFYLFNVCQSDASPPKMFVGSFEPDDFDQFQADVVATTAAFKSAGVTQLLIDLTNNGGGQNFYLDP